MRMPNKIFQFEGIEVHRYCQGSVAAVCSYLLSVKYLLNDGCGHVRQLAKTNHEIECGNCKIKKIKNKKICTFMIPALNSKLG